ncbi:hypothetical protein SSX86_024885 [Deinandra increscens subsp. villosa]|uniref:RNA-directed DNA polymerase, eukaryota n=1 Tax=Deinandra increscens subsp. villosa TaxID=3103831 RepID=A0AAP0CD71_9ASTR
MVRRSILYDKTNFFVAGIREGAFSLDLWKVAAPLGTLVDAYIPNKRRFNKEKFGFPRYENVRDVKNLLMELNNVVISEGGGARLRSQVVVGVGFRTTTEGLEMRLPEVSYKYKVTCEEFSGYPLWNIIALNQPTNKEMELVVNRSIVALMNSSVDLVNIKVKMADIGFKNLEVKYIGGLHILIILPSAADVGDCVAAMLKHTQGGFTSVGKKIDTSVNVVSNDHIYPMEVTEEFTSWIPSFNEEEDFLVPPEETGSVERDNNPAKSAREDLEEGEFREGYGLSDKVFPCSGLQGGASDVESEKSAAVRSTSMEEVNGSTAKEDEDCSSQFVGKVGPNVGVCLDTNGYLQLGDSISQAHISYGPSCLKSNIVGSYPGPNRISSLDSYNSHDLDVEECTSDPLPGGREKQRALARRLKVVAKQGNLIKVGGKSMIWGSLVRSLAKSGKRNNRRGIRSSPSNSFLSEAESNVPCSLNEEVCLSKQIGDLVGVPMNGFEEQLRGIIEDEGEGDNQETQLVNKEDIPLDKFWGNSYFDSVAVGAEGRSGGLVSIWDPSVFHKEDLIIHSNFLVVTGWVTGCDIKISFVNVYGPKSDIVKRQIWNRLVLHKNSIGGLWIVVGDYNVVRSRSERIGVSFYQQAANDFKCFINSMGLVDLILEGHSFNYLQVIRGSLSKIHRGMVCRDFLVRWPKTHAMAVARELSDHCPIIIDIDTPDYGPIPFKIFPSWLNMEGFEDVINKACGESSGHGAPDVSLAHKLKFIKGAIK